MAVIEIYGEIGESWWFEEESITGKSVAAQLAEIPEGEAIALRINSVGGDVGEALAIYNLLKPRSSDITTYIDGYAFSAASFLALSGGKVVSPQSSVWMLHNPSTITWGDSPAHRKAADVLDVHRDAILPIYAEKTGKTNEEIIEVLNQETWLTGSEAVDFGLADETGEDSAAPINAVVPHWFRVSAKGKKKLKSTGHPIVHPKVAAIATHSTNMSNPKEQPDINAVLGQVQSLQSQVVDLQTQLVEREQAIAQREAEVRALQRKSAVTDAYNRVRSDAEALVKSSEPKISAAEFEAMGFSEKPENDIKTLLDMEPAEADGLLSQAKFYTQTAKARSPILQTGLKTGGEPLAHPAVDPKDDPQHQADMKRFNAARERQKQRRGK